MFLIHKFKLCLKSDRQKSLFSPVALVGLYQCPAVGNIHSTANLNSENANVQEKQQQQQQHMVFTHISLLHQ